MRCVCGIGLSRHPNSHIIYNCPAVKVRVKGHQSLCPLNNNIVGNGMQIVITSMIYCFRQFHYYTGYRGRRYHHHMSAHSRTLSWLELLHECDNLLGRLLQFVGVLPLQ